MGEEYYVRWTARISSFLVVVSFFLLLFPMFFSRKIVFYNLKNSVFWDLYCAAPERRDSCDHSSEAKAFHDYVCTCSFSFSLFPTVLHNSSGCWVGQRSRRGICRRKKYTALNIRRDWRCACANFCSRVFYVQFRLVCSCNIHKRRRRAQAVT